MELSRCFNCDFGEALLAGETGGSGVGFMAWLMIRDAKGSRRRRLPNKWTRRCPGNGAIRPSHTVRAHRRG